MKLVPNMEVKLETWKNKLLDLGKRNRLLNCRDTKRSNLRIKKPEIYDLWDSFVIQENPIEFSYIEEEFKYRDDDNALSEPAGSQASLFINDYEEKTLLNNGVITNQTLKEQQKTLRNLRNKAKIANEEQGINILYLSFGFVRWSESEHSDQYFDAPLILVPVELNWESITSPFILSLHEDEIVVNPTLLYKLENDFGIKLLEFDHDGSIEDFFASVSSIIEKNHWELIFEVSLGLLSFLKINMYKDLEQHKEMIFQNPIVRALCGDASALICDLSNIEDYDHDAQTPSTIFQVVDADSSQQDAIVCAKKGISFVLQGPPGTGKSQTITNIIAECLAEGKKVLFVSEKMAALDVVYRRLTSAKLNDFCLILHSHKANKKETLAQLGSVLNMTKDRASLSDDAMQNLDMLHADRDKLNEYVAAIHSPIQPLNKSIYEVNGYLANLQSYDDIIYALNGVETITQREFNYINIALTRIADVIGKMSNDFKLNPWYSANVDTVTNELRHDIGAYLNKLLPKTIKAVNLCDEITETFHFEFDTSIIGLRRIISFLDHASHSPKIPVAWIIDADMDLLFGEISNCTQCQMEYQSLANKVTKLISDISVGDSRFDISGCTALVTQNQVRGLTEYLNSHIREVDYFAVWKGLNNPNQIQSVFENAKEKITEYMALRGKILAEYEKDIFSIDYTGILRRFKSEYTSVFKIINHKYKEDKRLLIGLHRELIKKLTDISIVTTLNDLRRVEELKSWIDENAGSLTATFSSLYTAENTDFGRIEKMMTAYAQILETLVLLERLGVVIASVDDKEVDLQHHYEYLYNGITTDWQAVRKALNWAVEFREDAKTLRISEAYIKAICCDTETIQNSGKYSGQIADLLSDISKDFSWFTSLFESDVFLCEMRMPALVDRVEQCMNGLAALEEWIDFRSARKECRTIGIGDYVDKIEALDIPVGHIIPVFRKRFYRLWLDKILPNYPIVANFRRRSHEHIIKDFVTLDKLQFSIAKARIRSKLINDLPSTERFTSGTDEISVLKRELNKQRRIMPTRRLFKEIPNLILRLKPCLMMSPLSVSLFLEADSFMFDTVIFDEASQVCTENAVGAISRGLQVVIAGDSKQLPPTNFFATTTADSDFDVDEDNDEYDDTNAYESILDEAALLPERTLLWHYRSRHEHLITFSNAKIYKNNLITFPSNIEKAADVGVEYVHVTNGFYDRGGKKGNVIEAAKVADLVFEHMNNFPNRSLGVIAFGEVQQQAIDTAIRKKRLENQRYEDFFNEDREEPFFTKNLENVQGDERDTIIFSIGYAKDAAGKMHMIFGPLSKSGGERRLNVAITRAKLNVKLVGSILPTDIDTDRVSADGPKLLRSYIDFAINGPSVLLREITACDVAEHDSPFEESVYNFLDRKGYKLATQVGCSGYRIDMAVKHPTFNGRYVLGIECDGAAYHSARTARERDRLRQAVLEDMGWTIYRIWSTDWIKDPITEGNRLLQTVEAAIRESEIIPSFQEDEYSEKDESSPDDFMTLERKAKTKDQIENPYGFTTPKKTDFSSLPHDKFGYLQIFDCIELLVNNEYPIHYELLCQKLSSLLGREKATSVVRREVDYALQQMKFRVKRIDDFLYPAEYDSVQPRILNNRQVKHIGIDEFAAAIIIIAEKCIGATRESLITETMRAYGFARSGSSITTALNEAYEKLLSVGKIKEVDGKTIVN